MNLDKIKNIFRKKKDDDFYEEEEQLQDEKITDSGEILDEEQDPELKAKSLRKKAIMITGVAVVGFGVSAMASNMFFGSKPVQENKKIISSSIPDTGKTGPTSYKEMGEKYNNEIGKDGQPQQHNATGTQNPNAVQTTRVPASATAQPRTSGTAASYSGGGAQVSYVQSGGGSNAAAVAAAKEEAAAEKERVAVVNSALAFKLASDIVQGKAPEVTPLANAVSPPVVKPASYRYSDEDTPVSGGNFSLNAGTVIQATLLTGITSEVPNGDVVAQIRQNIYDSLTGSHLLIPQGSRLIGVSGSAGEGGNQRIGVVFKRIILPDGSSINLPDQKAIDGVGYPGLSDIYNEHRGSAYRTAFMSALLGAFAQSATGDTSGTENRSPGQEAVSGAVASLLQTGQKMVEKDLSKNATIEIQPGFQFSVFINQDLLIGEYVDL